MRWKSSDPAMLCWMLLMTASSAVSRAIDARGAFRGAAAVGRDAVADAGFFATATCLAGLPLRTRACTDACSLDDGECLDFFGVPFASGMDALPLVNAWSRAETRNRVGRTVTLRCDRATRTARG